MKKGKVGIKVRNGDVDRALRIFKKMVMESGHLEELYERQYFVKPSIAKREYNKKLRQKHLIERKNDNWVK